MDRYWVTIGNETYSVAAADYQAAKYEAASRLREQFSLKTALSEIACYAKASLIRSAPSLQ